MKDKISIKRKKYAVALLAVTAATVATSFSPSAPWVMASGGESEGPDPNLPPDFNPPTYTEVPFDPNAVALNIPYYHVEAGNNVSVTTNTFTADDAPGNVKATFNNFIVKANDTLVEDSDDIVVDTGNSENPEKGTENGVTRKYKLKLSDSLKEELKNAAGGGGGAAPSKFENGTNTTVEGDGTENSPYKYNVNPALTGITSITGDTLTLNGGATTVAITDNGVDVGGKKITNLEEGDVSEDSTDAVTGKQLDATNKKIEAKLDKTKERHIKPEAYTVNNGTVTLKYVDADGTETGEEATISGLNPVKSVTSGDANTLTVANNNGDITVTPVVATNVTDAGNANKLTTAGVVNTAINNAIEPLADKNLSNITDAGKKVITGLGTAVVQGDGVTVTSAEDATTGKKTYTISAAKLHFANGTNTTVDGDGTKDKPYKYNVNPALTGITSITGDTGLTFTGAGTAVTINAAGVNVGGAKVTNLADAALTNSSTDAVTGKQLHATNEKVEGKLDKTAERHIKPQAYTVNNGTVTLKYVDADGNDITGEEATISGLNPVKSVTSGDANTLTVTNNNGDITVTPVVAANITDAGDANKLATAGAVNTAITNATSPLADKNLSNITDAGKKVITGLGTEVVQGDGVTVTSDEDKTTGKKTYTISAVKPNFAAGTNTTVEGDGTVASPYKYNVNPALTGITSITNATTADGDGTKLTIDGDKLSVVNKKGADTTTVTIGKDGIDAGNKKITNVATPEADKDAANKEYVDAQKWGLKVQNGDNPAEAVTAKDKAITLKASADISDAADKPKKGIVIAKDDEGNITLGLEKADRTTLDHAVNIGNTASDGRDGQAGAGKDGATVAGSAGAQGPTGKDGLNGKDLTSKVNALRNGEAGTVVYTNAAGDRVVKANDGNYYKADEVKPDGNVKTEAENGGTAPVAVTPEARLVSPDGTVTNGTTVLNNISSVVTPVAGADTLEKLKEAAKDNSPVKNAATNVTDLHNTANAIVEKGLKFKGNLGDVIAKKLGEQLDIVGEGTVADTVATAANNIRTKNVDGKLEIGLVKDLKNITSITNAAPVDPAQPDAGKVASTTLTIDGNALTVENKQADGTKATVKIGKDGIDAGGKKITNVAEPTDNSDVATKKYVDDHAWDLHVDDGTGTGTTVVPKNKVITFKAGTGTIAPTDLPAGQDSPSKDTDGLRPKTGVVVETDKNGTITIGLEETARKTLDNAANIGNTGSDGRDGKAGAGQDGAAVAGSAGAQGPTGKDGLNGKDLTSKVNALRNGEAGTVVFTNAAGDRLVKANDGNYYKADEVEPNGEKKQGATAVPTKEVVTSLVSPDGTTTGAQNKLSNIADGTVSEKSKDAVNGSQLFNERVTNPTIFVDKDGNQVFKTTDGKFVDKNGAEVPAGKIHTKLNAGAPMTLDNVASALGEPAKDADYLAKLKEAKEGTTVNNSAVNVTDLHNTANAILEKGLTFEGDTANDTVKRKLGDTLKIHGDNNITVKKDATNADTLNVALQPTLTGITSITNAATADGAGTTLTINGDGLTVENKKADGTKATVTIGKDGIDADNTKITNVAAGQNDTDAVNVAQLKGIVNYATNVESRVNRLGAQSAAMAGLRHLQYDPLEPTTLMASVGTYKGQTALALGIAHYKNESLLFHAGASIGSNHDELMANAGVSWKFGSRADETAVKDAYRQGPISSSYTLQDKVSTLEAQNQLQKDEINELKAQLAEVLKYVKKG
ncbi:YadA-like family protein [Veillonella sp. VA142]|uniref:YadA-like family protein n=1 Tax=Veillonella sp. VA142 TaxID=741834 RepID=UPI000F8C6D76|nr:YadA-like family protein [Veillonella sp. VA142]